MGYRAVLAPGLAASACITAPASAQTTERASVSSSAEQGCFDRHAGHASWSISADGRFVAFVSVADNLFSGDTNGRSDVFVRGPLDAILEDGFEIEWRLLVP